MCTGKAYYDLLTERTKLERNDVAIIRIEQFYPLEPTKVLEALSGFAAGTPLVWYQDEPSNMGAWQFVKLHWGDEIASRFKLERVSRVESASPSTGSLRAHQLEERELLNAVFSR